MEKSREIEIYLNYKATPEFSSTLTKHILDFLLHYRNQIPFTFNVFEKSLRKVEEEKSINFKRLKLINLAKDAYEKICVVKELLDTELTSSRSIFLIFGKSLQTAHESYEIVPPQVNYGSPCTINQSSSLRHSILQLIQSDLSQTSTQFPATNIFLIFNRLIPIDSDRADLIQIRDFKLGKNCKKFRISFKERSEKFEIYQDDGIVEENINRVENEEAYWYQSKVFIKGFNDVLVNNKSIW